MQRITPTGVSHRYTPAQQTLLRPILVEGFADFVVEQASGGALRADAQREQHGLAHEAAL